VFGKDGSRLSPRISSKLNTRPGATNAQRATVHPGISQALCACPSHFRHDPCYTTHMPYNNQQRTARHEPSPRSACAPCLLVLQEEQEPEPEDEQLSPRRSSARLSAGDSQSGSDPPLGRKRRSSMRRGSEDVKVPQTVEEGEEGNASFKSGRKPSTEFSAEVTTPPAPP
jgi:hypothetical protein